MNNKKFLVGAIVAVIVIAIVAVAYMSYGDDTVQSTSNQTNSMSLANDATGTPPAGADTTSSENGNTSTAGNTAATKPKLSYDAALKQYKDKRIQLDGSCVATPKEVTYKNGTDIMIDNRANVARKIVFNTRSYSIPAYDYIVVSASSSTLPGITYLDCADKQNVARIVIQK